MNKKYLTELFSFHLRYQFQSKIGSNTMRQPAETGKFKMPKKTSEAGHRLTRFMKNRNGPPRYVPRINLTSPRGQNQKKPSSLHSFPL